MAKKDDKGISDIANELNRAAQSTQPVVKALDTISTKLTLIAKIIAGIDVKDSVAAIEQLGSASEKSAKGADALTTSTQALAAANASLEEKSNIAGKAMGKLGGALSGIKSVVSTATGFLGTMGGAVTGLIGGVFDLSKAIINIPLTMFNKLEEAAQRMRERGIEIAQAWEDVRKQFGDLNSTIPKTIAHMRTSGEGAKATGLSMFRVFGDVPEQIRAINSVMSEMGPIAEVMQDEFERNGQALLYFQKGLGLSNDQQKKMAELAKSTGKSLTSLYIDLEKQSQGLAEVTGLNAKTLSRDIADAMTDVTSYAGMATKEIAASVARVKSLGVAIKDVAGVTQAFKTFDTASQNAAKLGQAFGVVVNGFDLMKAKSPADKIEILRKAMAAAGKSAENMDARQLELLGSTSGLSPEIARQVFSMKNQGKSYEEIQKAADKSAKKHLTQEEALAKLSNSIERMHKLMSKSHGYFASFFEGMSKGMAQTAPMQHLLKNIGSGFDVAAKFGRQFGQMLIRAVPGLTDMIEGLASLLHPKNVGNFFKIFTDQVELFLTGKKTFTEMISGMIDGFNKVDGALKPGMNRFQEGILKFTRFVLKTIFGLFESIVDFFVNPKKANEAVGEGGEQIGKTFSQQMADSFKDFGTGMSVIWNKKIKPALDGLWDNTVKPWFKENFPSWVDGIGGLLLDAFATAPLWAEVLGGAWLLSKLPGMKLVFERFFGTTGKFAKKATDSLTEISGSLPKVLENIGKAIGSFFSGMTTGLVTFAEAMAAPTVLFGLPVGLIILGMAMGIAAALRIAAPVLPAIGQMFKFLGEALGAAAPAIDAAGNAISKILKEVGPIIESAGKALATVIGAVANGIVTVIEGISNSMMNLQTVDAVQLYAIAGAIAAMGIALTGFAVGSAASGIIEGLGKLFGVDPVSNLKRFETIDIAKLDGVSATLKTLSSSLAYFGEVTGKTGISEVFSNIGEVLKSAGTGLADAFNIFGTDIKSIGDSIQSFGIEDNLAALQNVVKKVSEFDMLLDDINSSKLNVQAKLDTFMKKAGITALTAESSKNFNLNKKVNIKLDLKVVMDANRVEQVILQRTDSKIRQIFNETTGAEISDDPNFNGPKFYNFTPK